jgi:hypothetical protein
MWKFHTVVSLVVPRNLAIFIKQHLIGFKCSKTYNKFSFNFEGLQIWAHFSPASVVVELLAIL